MQGITIAEARRVARRPITFVLAFSAAVLVVSGVSHAKPSAGAPLNATVCKGIDGVWTPTTYTCTIPEGTSGVVSSSFKIGTGITLDVQGGLTIPGGVTVANLGAMFVATKGGVVPTDWDPGWTTGVLIYGSLENSGTITIENTDAGTEGITVSFSVGAPRPEIPSPLTVVPGTLTNSGAIAIQNSGANTRGIKNMGILANSASGIVAIDNTLGNSVGLYNRRQFLESTFYTNGTVTNAGSVTIANSGDCGPDAQSTEPCGYGLYNQGSFTTSDSGSFVINASVGGGRARGLFNGGSITNHGTFTNDRGAISETEQVWGSFNIGTMVNYGRTGAVDDYDNTGTWANAAVMINLGTVTNRGIMWDASPGQSMINYGTIYNYGYIEAGTNLGLCIDEAPSGGGC